MTLLREIFLQEVVQPLDPGMDPELQLDVLEQRMAAAKRGLGFANKLKNPAQKKKHMGLVLTNLNKIRGALGKIIDQVNQFDQAERDHLNPDKAPEMMPEPMPRAMGESRTFKSKVDNKKYVEKMKSKQFKAKKDAGK